MGAVIAVNVIKNFDNGFSAAKTSFNIGIDTDAPFLDTAIADATDAIFKDFSIECSPLLFVQKSIL